ncbi:MAG TPA: ATP-dependent 6-phosphofructokinase [Actinomycetota bacterium]|nr:ATP-dependent 6-phosphofructokinase [Actinomycetota bacterium]
MRRSDRGKGPTLKRIGLLTGGGDCPGLNAAIRAVVRTGVGLYGFEVLGFEDGWRGVLNGEVRELTVESVQGILHRGGTILGSSGSNPFYEGGADRVRTMVRDLGIDGLIAIGGDGTLGAAARLAEEGQPVLGIPKTIDNDLSGTDTCIGFATAVQIATDAIDRLHTTAESHDRLMLVEVMGRSAGWIALGSGIAGGADMILIPERPFEIEEVASQLRRRHLKGHSFSIVVVAEGAMPVEGTMEPPTYPKDPRGFPRFGGIAHVLAPLLERGTGWEARVTVLGHVQRGGSPVAADRILATRFGHAAVELAAGDQWGRMVAARGSAIVDVPLAEAATVRHVPEELYRVAEVFFV